MMARVFLVEPPDELLDLLPAHTIDGQILSFTFSTAGIFFHQRIPLLHGYFVLPHLKWFTDLHTVHRHGIDVLGLLGAVDLFSSHHERPGSNLYKREFHPVDGGREFLAFSHSPSVIPHPTGDQNEQAEDFHWWVEFIFTAENTRLLISFHSTILRPQSLSKYVQEWIMTSIARLRYIRQPEVHCPRSRVQNPIRARK